MEFNKQLLLPMQPVQSCLTLNQKRKQLCFQFYQLNESVKNMVESVLTSNDNFTTTYSASIFAK